MNPARIPTQSENAWAVADARKAIAQYEAVQASSEAANDESNGLTWLTLIGACVAGLGLWALYATGSVLLIQHFGMAGLIASILGACGIVGAVASIGGWK